MRSAIITVHTAIVPSRIVPCPGFATGAGFEPAIIDNSSVSNLEWMVEIPGFEPGLMACRATVLAAELYPRRNLEGLVWRMPCFRCAAVAPPWPKVPREGIEPPSPAYAAITSFKSVPPGTLSVQKAVYRLPQSVATDTCRALRKATLSLPGNGRAVRKQRMETGQPNLHGYLAP